MTEFSLSPGHELFERNVSQKPAQIAGKSIANILRADNGPAFQVTKTEGESILQSYFNKPTKYNYHDWYQAWNALQYVSDVYNVRPIDQAKATKNTGLVLTGGQVVRELEFVTASLTGTFVIGETVSQAVTNATAIIFSKRTSGTNTYLGLIKVSGTFSSINIVTGGTSSATGTPTSNNVTLANSTKTTLSTYQAVEQGTLYNSDVAETTITNMNIASISKTIVEYTHAATDQYTMKLRTKLRGNQVSQKGLPSSGADSGILIVNGIETLKIGGDGTTINLLNATALTGWDLTGKINLITGGGALVVLGETITGQTSGASGKIANISSNTLTLSDVTGAFAASELINGSVSGIAVTSVNATPNQTLDNFTVSTTSLRGNITDSRLAVYRKYVTSVDAEIGIGVCSNEAAWNESVSTDMQSKFSSFFEFMPKFSLGEFAMIVFKKEDDGSFTVLEKWVLSWKETGRDTFNRINFAESVLASNSKYVYVKVNQNSTKEVNTGGGSLPIIHHSTYTTIYPRIGTTTELKAYWPVVDSTSNGAYNPNGYTQADIIEAYLSFENKDEIKVRYILPHELDYNKGATIAGTRKDCLGIVAPYDNSALVGKTSAEAVKYLVEAFGTVEAKFNSMLFNASSTFVAVYGNMKYQYDKYNDVNRWVNISGDVAGLFAVNKTPWEATAGTSRGVIKNAIKLAFIPNKTGRDSLYYNAINPIIPIPGEGNAIIYGQKTHTAEASALDRINVRENLIELAEITDKSLKPFVFTINDAISRSRVSGVLNPLYSRIKARRGLIDYMIVVNETNNTQDIVEANAMLVGIYVKPTRTAEFLKSTMTITQMGTSFSDFTV